MFTLGTSKAYGSRELYGMDIFDVREILQTPVLTTVPSAPVGVKGMVSLRGVIIPVLALAELMGQETASNNTIMIVAEHQSRMLAMLVDTVDNIVRLDESKLRQAPPMLTSGHLKSIADLDDGRLLQVLDMGSVLSRYKPDD
ncbi:chemotaxis protein CheW [Novimethylophilus kurashikiensis]|nr:chemotaxis protein CheW [Novimethylophilus kurashikiensis]